MHADPFPDLRSTIEAYLTRTGAEGAVNVRAELERARAFVEFLEQRAPLAGAAAATTEERLLTLPEVAALLQVPEEHAREMGRRGKLPVMNVGRYVRVRFSTLREWIDSHERAVSSARLDRVLNSGHDRSVPERIRASPTPRRRG